MSILKSIRKKVEKKQFENSLKEFPMQLETKYKRGLFIDCGTNLGQGYTFFKQYFTPKIYDAILIEPNPNCMAIVKKNFSNQSHITFMENAAWVNTEKLNFFGLVEDNRGKTSDGGSVLTNHNATFYEANKEQSIEVKALSLAELIKEKSKVYSQIIIKMDIESAEYEVLQDLINTKASEHISYMYIEFHSQYFAENEIKKYKDLEIQLIKNLKEENVGVSLWH